MATPFFTKATKLYAANGGLGGRDNYITDKDRQEEIVLTSPTVDWTGHIKFERNREKQAEVWSEKQGKLVESRSIEGMEIIYSLPNNWYHQLKSSEMSEGELRERLDKLTALTLKTERTEKTGELPQYSYAVHFNKKGEFKKDKDGNPTKERYKEDNFHFHIIFSPRLKLEGGGGEYQRDVYLTSTGIQARNKRDRAKDVNGKDLPPVHYKGEPRIGGFSSKDPQYDNRDWYRKRREAVKAQFEEWGVEFEKEAYFKTYHYGKGNEADKIKEKNKLLTEASAIIAEFKGYGAKFPPNDTPNAEFKVFLEDVLSAESENLRNIINNNAKNGHLFTDEHGKNPTFLKINNEKEVVKDYAFSPKDLIEMINEAEKTFENERNDGDR